MATRVNTKFVVILVAVLVLIVGGGLFFAYDKLTASADDHARAGEEAMQQAEIALASGNVEEANAKFNRAARSFNNANKEDRKNTGYLYQLIQAQEKVICDDLILADGQLQILQSQAINIHDTPGAAEKDRAFFYEMMHKRHRMNLIVNKRSAYSLINHISSKWLINVPDDKLANRWRAIASAGASADDNATPEERKELLDRLTQSIEDHPEDPWLRIAAGRFHLGDAQRIYKSNGSAYSPEVDAASYRAYEEFQRAIQRSEENPAAIVEALGLMLRVSSDKEEMAEEVIGATIEVARTLHNKLKNKEMRQKLYTHELNLAVRYITMRGTGNEKHPFDGLAYSLELAEAVAEDRKDDPSAKALLAALYSERKMLDEAEKTAEAGLKILNNPKRFSNGQRYMLDVRARLDMLSTQAEVKINLAQLKSDEPESRKKLLADASKLIKKLDKAPSPNLRWREARVNFLDARIAFSFSRWASAIKRFDEANKYYKNSNLQLLMFLAETHRKLGNNTMVTDTYERIVSAQPMSPLRLSLIHTYLNEQSDQKLDKAASHLNIYLAQFPNDVTGIRLKAGLLTQRGDYEGSIALLKTIDIDQNPDLRAQVQGEIASNERRLGNSDRAIQILRDQLANRPEGQKMNLSVINQLLTLMPTLDDKIKELNRLETAGLDPDLAEIMRKFISNGRLTVSDEMTLLEAQGHSPGALAIRKFMVYQRVGQPDLAKQELAKAVRLEPDLPEVIEWQFRIALSESQWDDAELAVRNMLDLDIEKRPALALADGAFMRAQIIAARAVSQEPGPGRDKLLREASLAYDKALENYKYYVDGWVQLGRVQLVQNNYFAAKESLREALSLQSRNISALENMARAEIAVGEESRAIERYELILRLQPGNRVALNQFTLLSKKLGESGRAVAQRERIRRNLPGDTHNRRALAELYAEQESYDRALEEINSVIDFEGVNLANLVTLSRILVLSDQPDQAIKRVTDYLTSRGQSADWRDHLLMAQTYEWAQKPTQADASYQKAIELEDPENVPATMAWAQALLKRGEVDKAASIYERLSQERPNNQMLKLQTVRVFLSAKLFEKADAVALTLNQSPERYQLLIQSALGQPGKLAVAIQRARSGVEAFPNDLDLRLQLAQLLLGTQNRRSEGDRNYDEPLRMAEKLLADNPDRVEVQMLLADIYLAMGRNTQAVGQLEKILKFAPSHVPANERLYSIKIEEARLLQSTSLEASQDRADEALGIVALLIKLRPELPLLYRRAGEAANLAGNFDQAADYFRTAFEKTEDAQDLASYANALLTNERGADAKSVLDDPKNSSMVANSLYLRALRGRAYAASGEEGKAAALFESTLKAADNANARQLLVRETTLAFKSDPDRAVQIVEAALGKELPAAIDVILASFMIQERRYAEAANRLAKFEIDPLNDLGSQFTVLMQLAVARQESDQLAAAKSTYDKAYKIMRDNPDLIPMRSRVHMLNNLAYLLADRMPGNEQQAIKFAREALAELPENEAQENVALIEDTLGWAYFKAGRYDDAIKVLESSVKKYELSANLLHLGRAYLADGKKNRALQVLDKAIRRARQEENPKMIEEAEKWRREAL